MQFEQWMAAFETNNDGARLGEMDVIAAMRLAFRAGAASDCGALNASAARDLVKRFEHAAAEHRAFPTIGMVTEQYREAVRLLIAAMRPGVEIVTAAIEEFERRSADEGTRNEYCTGIGVGYSGAAGFLEEQLGKVTR